MGRDHTILLHDKGSRERWTPLLTFLSNWGRPIRKEDGIELGRIEEAEYRLGFQLPQTLREWYLLSGYRSSEELTNVESLRLPEKLIVYDGALVFYDESQGTVSWGVREADIEMDDPPVVIEGDVANVMPTAGWLEQNKSLTGFLFQMEIKQTILSSKHSASGYCNEEAAEEIQRDVGPLGFPDWYWPVYPTRYLGSPDRLVELQGSGAVRIAARTEGELRKTLKSLPKVQWMRINNKYVGAVS